MRWQIFPHLGGRVTRQCAEQSRASQAVIANMCSCAYERRQTPSHDTVLGFRGRGIANEAAPTIPNNTPHLLLRRDFGALRRCEPRLY